MPSSSYPSRSRFSSPWFRVRRAVRWLALVAYSLALAGVPIVISPSRPLVTEQTQTPSESHPCQHRRCGCRTAAKCFSSCCCTTPAQRIAWLKQRGRIIPACLAKSDSSVASSQRAPASNTNWSFLDTAKCQGHDFYSFASIPAIPVVALATFQPARSPELSLLEDDACDSYRTPPASPPPKV